MEFLKSFKMLLSWYLVLRVLRGFFKRSLGNEGFHVLTLRSRWYKLLKVGDYFLVNTHNRSDTKKVKFLLLGTL